AEAHRRKHRSAGLDGFTQTGNGFGHRGRRMAMDAVHVSDSAGRLAGDSPGTLRSGFDRWLEPLADVSARDLAFAETGNSDRAAVADDGPAARVRSDIYPDRRWARVRDRDCQSLHLSHGVSLFQFR